MADYRVNLDIFAGPLDLLLYLVRKDEVDIYDISIAKITEQYIRYIEMLKILDIDLAGDFLVMAATLMQLKSAMLLPKAEPEQFGADDLTNSRAELIRQLLEYKKFKDAANLLAGAAEDAQNRFHRPSTIVERLRPNTEPMIDIEQVSVWDLLEAFDSIMKATGAAGQIRHIEDDTPIDLYQIEILQLLQTQDWTAFERIFESRSELIVMIGLFLAILELIREKLVLFEQRGGSARLYLRSLTDEPAEQAVQKAIAASDMEAGVEQPAQTQQPVETPLTIFELPPKNKSAVPVNTQKQEKPSIPIAELPAKAKPAACLEEQGKEKTETIQDTKP